MRDEQVTSYVEAMWVRLVNAIPNDLRHDRFRYTFELR